MDMKSTYRGTYAGGVGRSDYLKLIDDSFSMLHPNPRLPYIQMLYNPGWDTYKEGFIWGNGFWMQNSYGFAYGAMPFLSEKWRTVLQNSLDLFWNRIGDGHRIGADDGVEKELKCLNFCAPDGSLGDCVIDDGIVYRQGDGPIELYDWFYEATACGILLECDLLLFDRDADAMRRYIPLMRRSMEFIEKARAENGLFLTGASSNLLAPSYGGSFDEKTKTLGKAYLTGISVTYGAALKKLVEVAHFVGDSALESLCRERYDRTLSSLPLLLTDEGYLVKSMDPDGELHGVYGAERHGYLEAVCNVDAIVHGMVTRDTAQTIYKKIASVEGIRPAGILCNNYPSLDDSIFRYLDLDVLRTVYFHKPGNWVDGGCWSTVEGRAIIAYLETGHPEDAFRAADCYMRWAEDYRQDQPMCQWGFNTCNAWQQEDEENDSHDTIGEPVGVMLDNFATATGLVRGLFSYIPFADGLALRMNLPRDIGYYSQHEPVRFGSVKIRIRAATGDCAPKLYINGIESGRRCDCCENGIFISETEFTEDDVDLFIDMSGEGYRPESVIAADRPVYDISGVPEDLAEIFAEFEEKNDELSHDICDIVRVSAERRRLPFDAENFRPMTPDKIEKIIEVYDDAVRVASGHKNSK